MFEQNMQWIACISSGVSITLATLVIVDFITYTSNRYKERYIQEASVELEDVLLQIPPGRILDFSFALSAVAAFIAIVFVALGATNFTWPKALFFAISAAIVAFPSPRLYLRYKRKKRLVMFNEQLSDALTSMSSALKAGFSINQAIEVIADENKRPISIEFRLLVQEIRLGVPLDQALENMVKRLGSDDFELVATAIITARQTGGELTMTFSRLADMIRERMRINGKLRALTAQGKLQATVIALMPVILLFVLVRVVPAMMDNFFNSIIGIGLMIIAAISIIIGFFVIKKITTIDV